MRKPITARSLMLACAILSLTSCGGNSDSGNSPDNQDPQDSVKPAKITDLRHTDITTTSVTLAWTAPGDDGSTGRGAAYDLRRHSVPIVDSNWSLATQLSGEPNPKTAGSNESFIVTGLDPATAYSFAIKTVDDTGNWSVVSNCPSVTTLTPNLDSIPPAAVANLTAIDTTARKVVLSCTMPGDDSLTGTAALYVVKYSTSPIDTGNWESATLSHANSSPKPAGSQEVDTVDGLSENTTYYFGIRTKDELDNWSGVSPNAVATTLIGGFDFGIYGSYNIGTPYTRIASIEIADINDDGAPDMLIGDGWYDRAIYILLNSGTGLLSNAKRIDLPDPMHPAVGDHYEIPIATSKWVGYDSIHTSIVTGYTDPNVIAIYYNVRGNLDSLMLVAYSADNFSTVPGVGLLGLTDMDGDRDVDILAAGGSNNSGGVTVLWNKNLYNLTPPSSYGAFGNVVDFSAGDYDGNGTIDVADISSDAPILGVDFKAFGPLLQLPLTGVAGGMASGDLDGGTGDDIVVTTTDSAFVFLSGGGTFTSYQSFYVGETAHDVAIGDLDLDGYQDIAVAVINGIYFLKNMGDGQFVRADRFDDIIEATSIIKLADLDMDGDLDIVVSAYSNSSGGRSIVYRFTNYAR